MSAIIAIMSRAPSADSKTRLCRALGVPRLDDLAGALIRDTIAVIHLVDNVERALVFTPPTARDAFSGIAPSGMRLIPQRAGDLGARMRAAFDDLLDEGAREGVALIGSDLPDLPPEYLRAAVRTLSETDDPVVLGPAADGGYYLIGLRRPHPELFSGVDWGSPTVLERTLKRAKGARLDVRLLGTWHDVDTVEDLRRVRRAPGDAASHTRRWIEESHPAIRERLGPAGERTTERA